MTFGSTIPLRQKMISPLISSVITYFLTDLVVIRNNKQYSFIAHFGTSGLVLFKV